MQKSYDNDALMLICSGGQLKDIFIFSISAYMWEYMHACVLVSLWFCNRILKDLFVDFMDCLNGYDGFIWYNQIRNSNLMFNVIFTQTHTYILSQCMHMGIRMGKYAIKYYWFNEKKIFVN